MCAYKIQDIGRVIGAGGKEGPLYGHLLEIDPPPHTHTHTHKKIVWKKHEVIYALFIVLNHPM